MSDGRDTATRTLHRELVARRIGAGRAIDECRRAELATLLELKAGTASLARLDGLRERHR